MIFALFLCTFAPLTFVARLAKYPADPRSVISLVIQPAAVSKLARIIVLLYQFYKVAMISASLWFTVCTVTVFLRTFICTVRAMR